MSKRTEKVADLIRRELADIVMTKLRDPRIGFLTITGVEVTGDLSLATIYVSSLDGSAGSKTLLKTLTHAVPYLRHELAPRLGLREVPEMRFLYDESIERGARVEDLLRRIEKGEAIDDEDEAP